MALKMKFRKNNKYVVTLPLSKATAVSRKPLHCSFGTVPAIESQVVLFGHESLAKHFVTDFLWRNILSCWRKTDVKQYNYLQEEIKLTFD